MSDGLRVEISVLRIRNFVMIIPGTGTSKGASPRGPKVLNSKPAGWGSIAEAFLVDVLLAYDWSIRLEW